MAKREYKDGERRYYHGIDIRYSERGEYQCGYQVRFHWYLRMNIITSIGEDSRGTRVREEWKQMFFPTLAEAKRFIDEF